MTTSQTHVTISSQLKRYVRSVDTDGKQELRANMVTLILWMMMASVQNAQRKCQIS